MTTLLPYLIDSLSAAPRTCPLSAINDWSIGELGYDARGDGWTVCSSSVPVGIGSHVFVDPHGDRLIEDELEIRLRLFAARLPPPKANYAVPRFVFHRGDSSLAVNGRDLVIPTESGPAVFNLQLLTDEETEMMVRAIWEGRRG